MESTDNLILHSVTIDKQEVQLKSPNMEQIGLLQCLKYRTERNVNVTEIVTDASTSVLNDLCKHVCNLQPIKTVFFIATKYPQIHHSMDVWHKLKKLKKALHEVSYTIF